MVKFIVLVFALLAMSNKKLKIQDQKRQYVYSFKKKKKIPRAFRHLCYHFQILCNKRLFIFSFSLNSGQLT